MNSELILQLKLKVESSCDNLEKNLSQIFVLDFEGQEKIFLNLLEEFKFLFKKNSKAFSQVDTQMYDESVKLMGHLTFILRYYSSVKNVGASINLAEEVKSIKSSLNKIKSFLK